MKNIAEFKGAEKLASKLGIPKEDCHFGHFNEEQLKRAWQVIKEPNWWR